MFLLVFIGKEEKDTLEQQFIKNMNEKYQRNKH